MNFPLYSVAIFPKTGFNILHGPHQSAQKSTKTGIVSDFFMTSCSKFLSVICISIFGYNCFVL